MLDCTNDQVPNSLVHVVDHFEKTAVDHCDHLAVVTDALRWTFGQVNVIANQIANTTLDRTSEFSPTSSIDDAPETVAVLVPLEPQLIPSTLAAFKSGKAPVPLNPNDLEARLARILSSTSPSAVIANSRTIAIAKRTVDRKVPIINVDEISPLASADNPNTRRNLEDLAYVAFTSGSTGHPKGVMHTHASLSTSLTSWQDLYCNSPADRCTLFGLGTGAAIKTMLIALLHGATVFPLDIANNGLQNPARWLHENRITVLTIVPQLFRVIVDQLSDADHFPEIRLVRLNSDQIFRDDIRNVRQYVSDQCRFVNALSTTETGMITSVCVDETTIGSNGIVPVGFPLPDVEVLLLDEHEPSLTRVADQNLPPLTHPSPPLFRCAVGGEGTNESAARLSKTDRGIVAVSSPQLAVGYWRDPELTRRHFIPHPHDPSRTIFRTSDVGQFSETGSLTLLGRSDFQTKIRGYLVDLSEIDATMLAHPSIRAAIVQARQDGETEKFLVAYYERKAGHAPIEVADLKEFVSQRQPSHMVPSAFVELERMPLLPNDKVDRTRLPAVSPGHHARDKQYEPPSSDTERAVADAWGIALGIDRVGIHDNFFHLGGNSLAALRVLLKLEQQFDIRLSVRHFFDASTVAELASRIEERPTTDHPRSLVVTTHDPESHNKIPLTFSQRRVWFLDRLEPGKSQYNMSSAFAITGMLDVECLHRALEMIVDRHETLRSVVRCDDGKPYQVVLPSQSFAVQTIDLSSLSEREQQQRIDEHRRVAEQTPFDLADDMMLRAVILRVSAENHVLLVVTHHIASDGLSKSRMWHELGSLYGAFARHAESPLPPITLSYRDFALWQREHATDFDRGLPYWQKQLRGLPALELPTDRLRPTEQSHDGSSVSFDVSPEIMSSLRELSKRESVTLHIVLLSAFELLLSRYSGQEDFAVAIPVAGRPDERLEDLIGFFANTLVIRADLSGDPSACELLSRVRDTTVAAMDNADVPYERLVEALVTERDLARMPLAQVFFQFIEFNQEDLRLDGLEVERLEGLGSSVRFDLELQLRAGGDGLVGELLYANALFDADRMERFGQHYLSLLEQIAAEPSRSVFDLPLLSDADRHRLLVQWNDTAVDYPRDNCVHELFEDQVERMPASKAVACTGVELSYRKLNERANRLARYLRDRGVAAETLVGVFMHRSCDMLVALLGVAKAGGAYVPLDPSYPRERLNYILDDSNATMLLTEQQLCDQALGNDITTVCVDRDWPQIAEYSPENLSPVANPGHLVYVIYTSGSTGNPKGVMIEHRSLVNFLFSMRQQPGFDERDTLLAVTTISFDIAALELFLPLVFGGRLVIANSDQCDDGRQLAKLIAESRATVMQATPATWQLLLDVGWRGSDSLRVLCGGEVMPRRLADSLLEKVGELWNLYGPTETTIWSAVERVRTDEADVSIGRAIANTQLYILDRFQRPVPAGTPGELFIGGDGLARGYVNRLEMDEERFVKAKLDGDAPVRLYRTGDLARFESDGRITFLGRADLQVKVRGFRIELGEIESVLAQHPQVERAVVVAKEYREADKRLVAFVLFRSENEPTVSELRKHLREKLPDYMLPSAFVVVDRYPLTPNGKVDRAALLRTAMPNMGTCAAFQPPQTSMEQYIADVWKEVLGIEQVGLHDNFFDLGGHSLLSMKVIVRLEKKIGQSINPREIFMQTLQQLALACEHRMNTGTRPSEVGIGRQLLRAIKRTVLGP